MLSKKTISESWDIAEKYIEFMRGSDPRLWSMLQPVRPPSPRRAGEVCWDDDVSFCEVPLEHAESRSPAGYLLVATDQRFPPVIEYSTDGPSLTVQLATYLRPALNIAGITSVIDRYYFLTSTEIVARVRPKRRDSAFSFVRIPTLETVEVDSPRRLSRSPRGSFRPSDVRRLWLALKSGTPGNPGNKPKVVLNNAKPVRYQQNCDKYDSNLACILAAGDGGDHYCKPHCIAGCVPVAWGMLLSAWKRTGHWDSSKIWSGVSCWNIEWPSWGGFANPSQCSQVEATIWRLHALMRTTCGGSTSDSDTMRGAAIFGEMGLPWKFASRTNQGFDFGRQVTSAGQPYLFTGQGKWDALLNGLGVAYSGTPGKTGHAVVSYGYEKANKTILVALGWGTSFSDKWITFGQYGSTRIVYLTSLSAAARSSKMPLDVNS